jgi:hypothetical protein
MGEAWELSKKEFSFGNRGEHWNEKCIHLAFTLLILAEVFGLFWVHFKCAVEDWIYGSDGD